MQNRVLAPRVRGYHPALIECTWEAWRVAQRPAIADGTSRFDGDQEFERPGVDLIVGNSSALDAPLVAVMVAAEASLGVDQRDVIA